jgi:hypothetical protein
MPQINWTPALPSRFDHAIIGGRVVAFDEILNEAYFAPDKIKELSETFRHNTPYPHLIFEGLFSPILLELIYVFEQTGMASNSQREENLTPWN